jgi:hypothetical protein
MPEQRPDRWRCRTRNNRREAQSRAAPVQCASTSKASRTLNRAAVNCWIFSRCRPWSSPATGSEAALTLWGHPSLGHATFDDVPLNPFALRTSKRSQVLAQKRARLDRRQPHGRTASRALRALVLCVEHVLLLSVRSSEFPAKPPQVSRFDGIARNDFVLYGVALGTFEPAMFKAHGTRTNARQHHARRAARTSRALDGCERWAGGKTSLWHDTSLHLGGSVQHSQSPMDADTRSVMEPACASGSGVGGQYCSHSRRINE